MKLKAPSPQAPSPWLESLRTALAILLNSQARLTGPPPDTSLADLLSGLELLQVHDADTRPAVEAAGRLASRCAGLNAAANLQDVFGQLVEHINAAVARSLSAGDGDSRIIRVADFSELRTVEFPSVVGNSTILYLGLLSSLPVDHRLRDALPAGEFYLHAGSAPAIALGPSVPTITGPKQPRPWYALDSALTLTRALRSRQREQEAERAEQLRREARQSEAEFWASPLGVLHRQEQALERLKQAGKVPADSTIPGPAVRIGR